MTEENPKKEKENSSQALFTRDSYNKTIDDYKRAIEELKNVITVLEDDKAVRDSTILTISRERDAEKNARTRAESLLNEGKRLNGDKGYEEIKKETFEEGFTRK